MISGGIDMMGGGAGSVAWDGPDGSGEASVCVSTCGDGVIASDEACDWFASRLAEVWRKTIPGAEVVVEGQGYDDASVTFFEAGPRDRPSSRPPAM